jgi:putative ABC transport system permease protein
MFSDVRFALRSLISARGFSIAVIAILAVGIGANTAIFSIVDTVLLKPLPFADASRLVAIQSLSGNDDDGSCSYPDFVSWRAQATALDKMAAYASGSLALTGSGDAANLPAAMVTPDLLPMLGARPILGRLFTDDDDKPGATRVAVISEAIWVSRFSRDGAIVGRTVTLDGNPFTIVGVLPAAFQFPIQSDRIAVWAPLHTDALASQWMEVRGARFLYAIGHLRSGVAIERAKTELAAIASRLAVEYPKSNVERTTGVVPFQQLLVRDFRLALLVLFSAVVVILLIACANVANLQLARGTARQKEMAIRAALGAGRGRLVRQLLTESIVLSIAGGALAVLVAFWAVAALVAASPVAIPRLHEVRIDRAVLLFAGGMSVATGLLFGAAPAVFLSRTDAEETLKDGGRGATDRRSTRTRHLLVVSEVALSLVLLAGAGLLVRTLIELRRVNPGFVATRAIAVDIALAPGRYPDRASQISYFRRLLAELAAVPGIDSGAVTTTLPLSGHDMQIGFSIEGRPPAEPKSRLSASYHSVSANYFAKMGIPIVQGRAFTDRDREDRPSVVVVSEKMARQYWPNENPIGKRVSILINNTGPREVVGVAGDVKENALSEATRATMYTPFEQEPWPFLNVVVRAKADPASAAGGIRTALHRIDPEQAIGELTTVEDYIARVTAAPRFNALLISSFAGLALLLAAIGLYAVMSYSVALRRREIGIRMALGAQPDTVRALVVSDAVKIGAAGLAAGLLGALATTRVLQDLLFGVRASDPTTFLEVSALLLGVLVVAAYLPARRATQVDPIVALRTE